MEKRFCTISAETEGDEMTDKAEKAKKVLSQIDAHNRIIDILEQVIIHDHEYEIIIETCRKLIKDHANHRDKLIKRIHAIDNPDILELRYINDLTMEEIADEMGYSVRHVHRLHEKALEEFADIME